MVKTLPHFYDYSDKALPHFLKNTIGALKLLHDTSVASALKFVHDDGLSVLVTFLSKPIQCEDTVAESSGVRKCLIKDSCSSWDPSVFSSMHIIQKVLVLCLQKYKLSGDETLMTNLVLALAEIVTRSLHLGESSGSDEVIC